MNDKSRSSYSVYAQIMQWERAKRLAEYQEEEELEGFLTTSKLSPPAKKTTTLSRISKPKSSLTPVKNTSQAKISAGIILILGWLMGIVTYWGFTLVTANFTAQTEQESSVLLQSSSLIPRQFFL
ncbi:hypothetical protein [Limnoraphis robusta]|uniref:Uncharacterized protein n=1 Tax=Limnoraphis robusta CCNP1315 TaxID=3110306 RepID=A0ABU5U0E5_9CYAN|nr:hypothetical protein [Limnoraphis robusta]MEA5497131.1 hypothetical protein [Limnoraphis robusta BA-68 BA1]MEA5520666.1 hypothetical protein [Limnoraphis robusta CCNP1315]MEA5545644.1 hypothetical protein [Limnoraphis robusta CCNP1324]